MGRSRKFVDKKRSTTYSVVHRSQQDGAYGSVDDPSAYVLVPQTNATTARKRRTVNELGLPNDGYDYTQHLRAIVGGGTFVSATGETVPSSAVAVPSEALPSEEIAEREADAVNVDPELMDAEVRAALFEDDEDFEELADDFVIDANQQGEDDDEPFDYEAHIAALMREAEIEGGEEEEEEEHDHSATGGGAVTDVDDAFEAALAEYDSDEEEERHLVEHDDEFFEEMLDETLEKNAADEYDDEHYRAEKLDHDVKERVLETQDDYDDENVDAVLEEEFERVVRDQEERESRLDCESVLSTLSNFDNRPAVLRDGPRTTRATTRRGELPALAEEVANTTTSGGPARTEESPAVVAPKQKKTEDRAAKAERKARVKAEQRLARERKKATKEAWAAGSSRSLPSSGVRIVSLS